MTDEIEVGLRRVPGLDLAAPLPESDPELLARIVAEIRDRGPMPFARFMELALYDPERGYYARPVEATEAAKGPGRDADFLTAPESHPIFGWAIARLLEQTWEHLDRPLRFVVREHGAGSGALAEGILDGLRRSGSALLGAVRYQAIDRSGQRLAAFRRRVADAGFADRLEDPDDTPEPGAVLANELLDAFPVHRIEGAASDDPRGPILERFVDLDVDGGLTTTLAAPSTPALAERLAAEAIKLAPGQPAEIALGVDDWVRDAAAPLERGLLLVIDYGAPAPELYTPARGSTLRAYHRHRVHADPLVAVGRQDLTAHVDLTAVERAAVAAGLEPLGRTTQARFLANLGLGELLVGLQTEPTATLESYLAARSAVARMLDPRATGGFAVLGFGRAIDPAFARPWLG